MAPPDDPPAMPPSEPARPPPPVEPPPPVPDMLVPPEPPARPVGPVVLEGPFVAGLDGADDPPEQPITRIARSEATRTGKRCSNVMLFPFSIVVEPIHEARETRASTQQNPCQTGSPSNRLPRSPYATEWHTTVPFEPFV